LGAESGNGQVTITWTAVTDATSYNIYWGTDSAITISSGTKASGIQAVTYTHRNLTNGTTYFYLVTAVNSKGESAASTKLSAIPQVPVAGAPSGATAHSGDTQATIHWNMVSGATSYNLYWSNDSGVTIANGTKQAGISAPPYTHNNLTNGKTYYYIITAENGGGESAPSSETSALPQVPAASAPTGLTATSGNSQTTVNWTSVDGASSYNLYWSNSSGVTVANGIKVSGIAAPPYTHLSLSNGQSYYYVVTAVNAAGESAASTQASATPEQPIPLPPSGLNATAGNAQVDVNWLPVSDATSYNLYWSTSSWLNKGNGTKIAGISAPPFNHPGLTNGQTYYYLVTAVNSGGESGASNTAIATPVKPIPAAPVGVKSVAWNCQSSIEWDYAAGASSYNVYWSTTSGVTTASPNKISGITSNMCFHPSLTNGQSYFYVVTAVNSTGESSASAEISCTPHAPMNWSLLTVQDGYKNWKANASSADGSKLAVADSSGNIYTSADSGVTWIARTAAGSRSWQSIAMSTDGTKLAACVNNGDVYTSTDGGATWIDQTAAGSRPWRCITSSADGAKLAACANTGSIYTSTDGGASWTERSSAGSRSWESIASSADGLTLVASYFYGQIYISTDGGATWIVRITENYYYWSEVTCSADGQKIAALEHYLWTSSDGGATWSKRDYDSYREHIKYSSTGALLYSDGGSGYLKSSSNDGATWTTLYNSGVRGWQSIAVSGDGSNVFATTSVGSTGDMYTSSDSGQTWLNRTPGFKAWHSILWSSDQQKIVNCGNNWNIISSNDGGTTWSDRNSGTQQWNMIAGSVNGTVLAASASYGYITTSTDSGVTWTKQTAAGSLRWNGISSSADGQRMAAIVYEGGIYTSIDLGSTWIKRDSAGSRYWSSIASSSDGLKLAACAKGDLVYTSADGGINWTPRDFAGPQSWRSIVSSADGNRLVATAYNGRVYTSTNAGGDWIDHTAPEILYGVSSSTDGLKLAAIGNGYIYTSKDGGISWMKQSAAGSKAWTVAKISLDGTKVLAGESWGDLWLGQP
jgi:photosystem II stability/assembly factor-like uncharacterized protein/fibronectin type 3 domain-containing protein